MTGSEEVDGIQRRQMELLEEIKHPASPLYLFALLDALVALFDECTRVEKNTHAQRFVEKYGPVISKLKKLRLSSEDFKVIKTLGRGAFGEVNLVKCKVNDRYYAIKKLNKAEMLSRQEAFFMEERDLLGLLHCSWVTNLEYAFQDDDYLYLVMEYLAGGNMLSLLFKHGSFEEEKARFYIAETILGVQKIHEQGFVYRDLKPENMLFDKAGHVKLADFGSCYKLNKDGQVDSQVAAGTPDYIAPEVLQNNEGIKGNCGKESDWWSVGVVLYEMLCADPPFMGDNLLQTYAMIMNHKEKFKFPDDVELSEEAKSLMKGLITDRKNRLTYEEIIAHPFFKGLDWATLANTTPPFVPELKGPDDTTYFEDEELPDLPPGFHLKHAKKGFSGENFPFIGYSFSRSLPNITGIAGTVEVLSISASVEKLHDGSKEEIERLQQKITQEKQRFQAEQKELEAKLKSSVAELEAKAHSLANEIQERKKAQENVTELEKEKIDLELHLQEVKRKLEKAQEAKQADTARIEDLEEQLKAAHDMIAQSGNRRATENESLRLFLELKQKFDAQSKELQEALTQESDLKSKSTLLDSQVQKITEALETEKKAVLLLTEEVQELEKENAELLAQVEKDAAILHALATEHATLNKEIDQLKAQIQVQKSHIQELQAEKQKGLNEKTKLLIGIQELTTKITMAAEREKELTDGLEQQKLHQDANEAGMLQLIEQYKTQLASEKQAKDNLIQKKNALTADVEKVTADIAEVKGQLDAVQAEHDKTVQKFQELHKLFEQKVFELAQLETQMHEYRNQNDASSKVVKELTQQKQKEEEKTAQLEQTISELEKAQEESNRKLAALKVQHDDLVKNNEVLHNKRLSEIQRADPLKRVTSEEVINLKQTMAKEIAASKTKLDHAIRHSSDLEEQVSRLQKEKAKSEVEKNSMEKELSSERAKRIAVEEKIAASLRSLELMKSTSLMDLGQIEDLASQREDLAERNKEKAKELESLDEQTSNMKTTLENIQMELENLKSKLQGAPRSEVKEKREFRKLREEYALLQMRVQNEELAKRTMAAKVDELTESNDRLTFEIDNIKRQLELAKAERPKLPPLSEGTKSKENHEEPAPATQASHAMGVFGSIRKTFSIRRPKAESLFSIAGLSAGGFDKEKDFHFTPFGVEGHLKVPKDGKIQKGWVKKFVVIKDYQLFIYDKEKEKDKAADVVVDLRWGLFLCKAANEATLKEKKEDLHAVFTIQAKDVTPSKTPQLIDNSDIGLTPAQIQAKMKAIEKEIEIEVGILKGVEKMVKLSSSQKKTAQQQLDGSRKKMEQLKQHHARLGIQLEAAGNNRNKKIQLVEESIASEEKYQQSLKNLLDMADTEEEKQNTSRQLEESMKKLSELRKNLEKEQSGSRSGQAGPFGEEFQLREFNGHRYKVTTFDLDVHCHYCGELLVKRHGFFCLGCDDICHNECHTLGKLSCSERIELKSVPQIIFQAHDLEERDKWIDGINTVRETYKKDGK